jgi:hypothetical protein
MIVLVGVAEAVERDVAQMEIAVPRTRNQQIARSEIEITGALRLQSGNRLRRTNQREREIGRGEVLHTLAEHGTRRGGRLLLFLSPRRVRHRQQAECKARTLGCGQE